MSEEEWQERGPSRSAKKRAAKAVEEMAWQLTDLPEAQFKKLPLEEETRKEIDKARSTKGHGSRKRQVKHLAGFLRRREDEVILLQDFLEDIHKQGRQEKKAFHDIEDLRDRICDPAQAADAIKEAVARWPQLDADALSRLAKAVHLSRDRRAFREIFRRLRTAAEKSQST